MSPTRREALLLGAGLALAGCGTTPLRSTPASRRIRSAYGAGEDQFGVLRLPPAERQGRPTRSTVVLLHGGFWLADYGLDLMDDLAEHLTARGHPTWNVEYRRLGRGGEWPGAFEDVAGAIDHLRALGRRAGHDLAREVTVLGHSAGGQLAVWAASRTAATPGGAPRVRPRTTISLSGVLDLTRAEAGALGGGVIAPLMGGTPRQVPGHYRLGDPTLMVPAHGRVLAVVARDDTVVPPDQSRRYVETARRAAGDARLVTVPGGHFDLIDPGSPAWRGVPDL